MSKNLLGKLNLQQTALQAGILLAFLLALFFGFAGVDYGPQWDQNLIKGQVNKYIRTGDFLPGEYVYPPVSTYIATTTLIPYAIPFILRYGTNWVPTQQYLVNEVLKNPNDAFLWNLRRVFVFFTILAIVWVGIAVGQKDWLAGLVAAAALAFSWEISYHSRLIHPDGPAMQFGSLALMFSMLAFYKKKPFNYSVWLVLATVAAAAAAATKYTSGIFLIAVLVFAFGLFRREGYGWWKLVRWLCYLVLIFSVVFIVLVPGVFLEQSTFFEDVSFAQRVYARGHGLQTVDAGWDHFQRILQYVFLAAFSSNPVLATFIPTLALIGVFSLLKTEGKGSRNLALTLGGIPFLYILFLTTNRVMFVRNLLIVLPSLAILAGFGFVYLLSVLKPYAKVWRGLLIAALILLIGVNFQRVSYAAWTIQMRTSGIFTEEALREIKGHPELEVYITPQAARLLGNRDLPVNATLDFSGNADKVLFAYLGDVRDEEEGFWPVNFFGASPMIFGPMEINMDWYASWPGVERFVLSIPALAWQDGAPLVDDPAKSPLAPTIELRREVYLDGENLYVKDETGKRYFFLNSANPKVILALRPFLESPVTIIAKQYSFERNRSWFLLAVNGEEIISESRFELEFHTIRLLSNLSEEEKTCFEAAVGPAKFKAMTDNILPMIDLSDEELISAAACIDSGKGGE